LKDSIKNELYKEEWPDYEQFIERAIIIDAKQYARSQEKKGKISLFWSEEGGHKRQ
jgi:hypothetical protein